MAVVLIDLLTLDFFTQNSFICRFNTQYNFTIWTKYSNGNFIHLAKEIQIHYDLDMVYLFGTINKNTYLRSQVYPEGQYYPDSNQTNILIISYSYSEGIVQYTRLLGDPILDDYYVQSSILGGS